MADQTAPATQEPCPVNQQEPPMAYQLKWISWKNDKFIPIITQNKNGPCPIIAICNVLTCQGKIRIAPGNTAIPSDDLTQLLAERVLESKPNTRSEAEEANHQRGVQDSLQVFPKLHTGIDVNVKFSSVDAFEYTPEIGLFDLVGVSLFHGWVADPQERDLYSVVGHTSYNQLVSMAIGTGDDDKAREGDDPTHQAKGLLAREYLESTASQLTQSGLDQLQQLMREDQFAVLFRNNHFTTIHKRQGTLYELITDLGYLNEHGHVWQSLTTITGDGEYFDSQFKSCASQPEFGTEFNETDLDREIALSMAQEIPALDTPPQTAQETTQQAFTQEDRDAALAFELERLDMADQANLNPALYGVHEEEPHASPHHRGDFPPPVDHAPSTRPAHHPRHHHSPRREEEEPSCTIL